MIVNFTKSPVAVPVALRDSLTDQSVDMLGVGVKERVGGRDKNGNRIIESLSTLPNIYIYEANSAN